MAGVRVADRYASRRERLLAQLREMTGAQAMLLTNPANVAWISGFTGSNGAVLLTHSGLFLATDGRYRDQAAVEVPDAEIVIDRAVGMALLRRAETLGHMYVGIEANHVPVDTFAQWIRYVQVELMDEAPDFSALRMVKDAYEIDVLRRACDVSTAALNQVAATIRPGMTEIEIARSLEAAMGAGGADDRAFPTIVASGPNSAIPHHQPTLRTLTMGDLLKIDFGARIDGYHADCTRTFVIAADPEPWQRELHDLVDRAAAAGRAALVPGASFADVDNASRSVIVDAGHGEHFTHGLGHGVGLEIHEAPLFAAASVGTLEAGVVATIEPGVYLPGQGGVRIEDTCLVTETGSEVFTDSAPRELLRLG